MVPQPVTDPSIIAWVVGTIIACAALGIGWLMARVVKNYDEQVKAYNERMAEGSKRMDELGKDIAALRINATAMAGRMAKAEADIANDKQGRAAFIQMQHDLGRLIEAVSHLTRGFEELSSRVNAINDQPPPRRIKRVAAG